MVGGSGMPIRLPHYPHQNQRFCDRKFSRAAGKTGRAALKEQESRHTFKFRDEDIETVECSIDRRGTMTMFSGGVESGLETGRDCCSCGNFPVQFKIC